MLKHFHRPWREIPQVWIDTETTGVTPGVDAVVQLGVARFEPDGTCETRSWLVNPGRPIPPEATAVHGITDEMVCDAPPLVSVLMGAEFEFEALIRDAQPGAYNAPFDQSMLPRGLFDRDWPWLDSLTLVRLVDRFVKGPGRHKLGAACARHGIDLPLAHDAGADARAAGELFRKLASDGTGVPPTLGAALHWFELRRAEEWFRFHEWLSRQPPREAAPAA